MESMNTKKIPSTDNSQQFKSEKEKYLLSGKVAHLILASWANPDLHHFAKIVISGHALYLIMPCYNTTLS